MNLTPLNPTSSKNILQKILALLCFLILPLLFYVLTAYLTAALFQVLLRSMEAHTVAALFLEANLPIIYSGTAALFTGAVLGFLYRLFRKNALLYGSGQKPENTLVGSGQDGKCFPSVRHFSFSGCLCAAAFGASGAVFFNLLLTLSRLPELFPSPGTIEAAAGKTNPLLHFLTVCLAIPVAEELVFRGLGYFGIRRHFGPVFSGILTAVLFGIFHGNAPQTLYGFCMGLLLAHTAECCRNLTSVLLFHWAANITSFFFLGDPARQRLLYSIPFLGLSGIGCAWLFYRIKDLKN